jgi:hypothetical protein
VGRGLRKMERWAIRIRLDWLGLVKKSFVAGVGAEYTASQERCLVYNEGLDIAAQPRRRSRIHGAKNGFCTPFMLMIQWRRKLSWYPKPRLLLIMEVANEFQSRDI